MNITKAVITSALMALAIAMPALGQKKAAKSKPNPIVVLDTTMGAIKVELFPEKAPATVSNFLIYVKSGFYDGTIVHRVDFVAGFGGYTESLAAKPALTPIKNESKNGLKNARGTLSMARYDDPNSATSQFFINLDNNTHLDPSGGGFGYAVFGKVIEGMEVVDKIAKVKVSNKGNFSNVPIQTITVKTAKVVSP
jgi:peptidyl-prolyl cis-trans isomerase A (cyclophilin A)